MLILTLSFLLSSVNKTQLHQTQCVLLFVLSVDEMHRHNDHTALSAVIHNIMYNLCNWRSSYSMIVLRSVEDIIDLSCDSVEQLLDA